MSTLNDLMDQMNFDLADVLAESREWLTENGWGKGEFCVVENEYGEPDDDGECEILDYTVIGYCAMGGALYSQQIEESYCAQDIRALAVADALSRALGLSEHHTEACTQTGLCTCTVNWVTSWNDDDNTTWEMVEDAFIKAEKIARSGNVDA
jgi:hypothetical protein